MKCAMKAVTLQQLSYILKGGGRLVGLDVGTHHVGVAISDSLCRVASPQRGADHLVSVKPGSNPFDSDAFSGEQIICVLRRCQSENLQNIENLNALVKNHSVVGLTIGYPLELGGYRSNQEYMVKSFVTELQLSGKFQNICYLYWDERLTSAAVATMLAPLNVTGFHRQMLKDKMAAVSILQGSLDSLPQLK